MEHFTKIIPSFAASLEAGWLRIYALSNKPLLMVSGEVSGDTAAALRSLADEIDGALGVTPVQPALDLFGEAAR